MERLTPTDDEQQYFADLKNVVLKHEGRVPLHAQLALASQFVGLLLALQDQRRMTREDALAIISKNLEQGNKTVIETVFGVLDTGKKPD